MESDPRRRGFGRERYPALKLAITATALGGFALTWAALAAAHGSPATLPGPGTPTSATNGTAVASLTSTPSQPLATATSRPRTSRGS